MFRLNRILCLFSLAWPLCLSNVHASEVSVDFNRDIRPILSDRCFLCHGPDENQRESGLRLDERASALQSADSGVAAIVPHDSQASELVRRIFTDDPDQMMPPKDAGKPLTNGEKELLRKWVDEGAVYQEHWAFTRPQRFAVPSVDAPTWARNPVDFFILAKLEQEALAPSPDAEWATLFRRVTLDLTGLPPSPDKVTQFLHEIERVQSRSGQDQVYASWVEKLLNSPHYGERMAVDWLDLARYADSNGYQVDRDREMYAWRDWVINAFNSNLPFDQFTIEQLAGDLLVKPTLEQRIATGFNRNHMMNEEGGVIPEEFLAEYCFDRVETTATVWLGQTFNCCRCHDHKFDPFTQSDYYALYAFFHNITEKGIGNYGANIRRNAPPVLQLPAPKLEAQLRSLNEQLDDARQQLAEIDTRLATEQAAWENGLRESPVTWSPCPLTSGSINDSTLAPTDDRLTVRLPTLTADKHALEIVASLPQTDTSSIQILCTAAGETDSSVTLDLADLRVLREQTDETTRLDVKAVEVPQSVPVTELLLALDNNDETKATVTLTDDTPALIVLTFAEPATDEMVTLRIKFSFEVTNPAPSWELRLLTTSDAPNRLVPADIDRIVHLADDQRSEEDRQKLTEFFQGTVPQRREAQDQVDGLTKQVDQTDLKIPTTLVMQELASPRETFVLMRGAYNKRGQRVDPEAPAVLPTMAANLPRNRLGLAQWLVDASNPLPARVTVNRFWQSLFGTGLVRTSEDFGAQGEAPSHPELLDWLAVEFIEGGWDVKAMMRLLVTSSTYRQSSRLSRTLLDRDPQNRLLARGPRFRLQSEFVRDQALAASGLLVSDLGGPSVRPYHPPGLYEQVVAGSSAGTYVVGTGQDLYRRSLYTYWKRSVPNPAMLVFDAPFREICAVRRSRTNTPLQALNLMNDPTYIEAARLLAERMMREGNASTHSRISRGYQLLLGRLPSEAEIKLHLATYERTRAQFSEDPASANQLLEIGETSADIDLGVAELAAMTTVASTLLNLDETITKE